MLGDSQFLPSLKSYDKDNIDPKIMKVIRAKFIEVTDKPVIFWLPLIL